MGDLVIAIDIFSTFALKRHKCSAHSVRMNEYRQTPTSFHVSAPFFLMFHAQCRKSERQLARTLSPVTTLEWTTMAMRNFLATFIVKFVFFQICDDCAACAFCERLRQNIFSYLSSSKSYRKNRKRLFEKV